jgi:hypothetical protein
MSAAPDETATQRWRSRVARTRQHLRGLDPTVKGLLWSASAGFVFCGLNALMRGLTLQLDPFQSQFLRYLFGLLVLLPLLWRHGIAAYRPKNSAGSSRAARCTHSACACGSSRCRRFRSPT